ncbi:MAG: hypothetical protein QM679_01005 [Patulibacter sp.]
MTTTGIASCVYVTGPVLPVALPADEPNASSATSNSSCVLRDDSLLCRDLFDGSKNHSFRSVATGVTKASSNGERACYITTEELMRCVSLLSTERKFTLPAADLRAPR